MLKSVESVVAFAFGITMMMGVTVWTVSTLLAGDERAAVKLAARVHARPRERRIVRFSETLESKV